MELKTIKNDLNFLRQKSKLVDFKDNELENDIQILIDYTLTHDVWAMASVQLGILKQIVYIKSITAEGPSEGEQQSIILLNPKLIAKKGKTLFWEACESCMPNIGLVERPYEIKVKYQDVKGTEHIQIFEGFVATVISHELDHLDGILHMDRAIEVKQLEKEQRIDLRKQEPYKIISTDCEFKYKEEEKITNL